MSREFATPFYRSQAWESTRRLYIQSVNGLCEDCLAKGIYTPGKVVHHIQHLTPLNIENPEIALGFGNLRLVCQDCHAKEHKKQSASRYTFDERGNLVYTDLPLGDNA